MKIVLILAHTVCAAHAITWQVQLMKPWAHPRHHPAAERLIMDEAYMDKVRQMEEAAMERQTDVQKEIAGLLDNITANGKPLLGSGSALAQIAARMQMNTTDVLTADAPYVGLEFKLDFSAVMGPGLILELFGVFPPGKDPRFCMMSENGDFDLDKQWEKPDWEAGKHEFEVMLIAGGTKSSALPAPGSIMPIVNQGGEVSPEKLVLDATADVDLSSKKTMMAGTQMLLTPVMYGLPQKVKDWFQWFDSQHGAMNVELGASGLTCF